MKFQIEHTDTFGGEANYCWVNRKTIDLPDNVSDRALVQAAKKFAGFTGLPSVVDDMGDTISIRPRGLCQVVFITADV